MPAAEDRLSVYHERTRRRGVHPIVYWLARALIQPTLHLYFRLHRTGQAHIPAGGVILASNHRSFLDPWVVGCCLRRPTYFMAKGELFEHRVVGWFLNCMGAFPVRRGASDEQATATTLALLERGAAVVIFPEGTRHRSGPLHRPKRGVGRLALASGAPVVPIAVMGTERARRGWRIRPVRVDVRCGRPLTYPRVDNPSPHLASEVAARVWPCVELQWAWLGGPLALDPPPVETVERERQAA
jgi:1-acyl-sn-glycerol-3-phosphate acyltransferase